MDVRPPDDEGDGPSDEEPGPSPASVVVLHPAWQTVTGALSSVHGAVNAAICFVPALAHGEVSVALSSDAAMRELNARFRGFDKPTNVLSFPVAPGQAMTSAGPSGDIVIAYETLMREAAGEGKDPLHHLAHLTVHGLLHLAGYDHGDDDEAERMEALERRILADLGIHDPYRSTVEEDQPPELAESRL